MSESSTAPVLLPIPGISLLGEEPAMVCEGDYCELPAHLEAHVVNRRLDDDAV